MTAAFHWGRPLWTLPECAGIESVIRLWQLNFIVSLM